MVLGFRYDAVMEKRNVMFDHEREMAKRWKVFARFLITRALERMDCARLSGLNGFGT